MSWLTSRLASLGRLRPSRIGTRLLVFNLLLVFLPVAGIFYLDVYETELLQAQERSMVQQGRLVAAALGARSELATDEAVALLTRLERRGDARVRVYNGAGALVADSARIAERSGDRPPDEAASQYDVPAKGVRQRPLYRLGAWLARLRRAVTSVSRSLLVPSRLTPASHTTDPVPAAGPEVRAALEGKYGAATRPTAGQRSLTLHTAVPIRDGDRVVGAVLVSQSTFRILQALYDVRLRIFQIVVASLAAAVVLSLLVSATFVRPLVRLRHSALALADRRAPPERFAGVDRRDEVGDLARALEDQTRRLDAHIRLLESFAADVSHEFKNPLASIRTATEMIAATDDGSERARMLGMMTRDVDRLERLVSGVRELAAIDGQLAHDAVDTIDLGALIAEIVQGLRLSDDRVELVFARDATPAFVRVARDRMAQVFENVSAQRPQFFPEGLSRRGQPGRGGLDSGVVRRDGRRSRPWHSGHTPRARLRAILHVPADRGRRAPGPHRSRARHRAGDRRGLRRVRSRREP